MKTALSSPRPPLLAHILRSMISGVANLVVRFFFPRPVVVKFHSDWQERGDVWTYMAFVQPADDTGAFFEGGRHGEDVWDWKTLPLARDLRWIDLTLWVDGSGLACMEIGDK